jgi:hypothetical protein
MHNQTDIQANDRSRKLLRASALICMTVVVTIWLFWRLGFFLPRLDRILAKAHETEDPSLCRFTISPGACLKQLHTPHIPLKADFWETTPNGPINVSCASILDPDLKALCEVQIDGRVQKDSCAKIRTPFAKNDCLAIVAASLKDTSICQDTTGFSLLLPVRESPQLRCVSLVALSSQDPSMCNAQFFASVAREHCARSVKSILDFLPPK